MTKEEFFEHCRETYRALDWLHGAKEWGGYVTFPPVNDETDLLNYTEWGMEFIKNNLVDAYGRGRIYEWRRAPPHDFGRTMGIAAYGNVRMSEELIPVTLKDPPWSPPTGCHILGRFKL